MRNEWLKLSLFIVPALLLAGVHTGAAQTFLSNSFGALLIGYEEVPPVFTNGSGTVQVRINSNGTSIFYRLSYSNLSSAVTEAHIHFAERPVTGGIIVYLCDNTGIAPLGTPACPNAGTVTGNLVPADVNPPNNPAPVTGQGIAPGNFAGLVGAIQHGDAYANVHTAAFPGGELRGWLR
jgi:hypothetical protein